MKLVLKIAGGVLLGILVGFVVLMIPRWRKQAKASEEERQWDLLTPEKVIALCGKPSKDESDAAGRYLRYQDSAVVTPLSGQLGEDYRSLMKASMDDKIAKEKTAMRLVEAKEAAEMSAFKSYDPAGRVEQLKIQLATLPAKERIEKNIAVLEATKNWIENGGRLDASTGLHDAMASINFRPADNSGWHFDGANLEIDGWYGSKSLDHGQLLALLPCLAAKP